MIENMYAIAYSKVQLVRFLQHKTLRNQLQTKVSALKWKVRCLILKHGNLNFYRNLQIKNLKNAFKSFTRVMSMVMVKNAVF